MLLFVGCSHLPPGHVNQLTTPLTPRVVLVRGFLDWYSAGIDRLADDLRAAGFSCVVFRDSQWHQVADTLAHRRDAQPIVLIGFSYGADDVVSIARQLSAARQRIALLITIDPVTPARVPPNVGRCVNYYQSNGVWDAFPWLRGIPLSAEATQRAIDNIDIRHRTDLLEPDTRHATIAANSNVHAAIIAEVKRCLESGRPSPSKERAQSHTVLPAWGLKPPLFFQSDPENTTPEPRASGG